MNTDYQTRLRLAAFDPQAPVSPLWRAMARVIFTVMFAFVLMAIWVILRGVWRVHKRGIVWGERLMS